MVNTLLDNYFDYIKKDFSIKEEDNYTRIITPYLDSQNDYIEFYITKNKELFEITDDGNLLNSVYKSVDLKEFREILNQYDLRIKDNEIIGTCDKNTLCEKIHEYIQAQLKISAKLT